MDILYCYINSSQLRPEGNVIETDSCVEIEGVFCWTLPRNLLTYANDNWVVRVTQLGTVSKISNVRKSDKFSVDLTYDKNKHARFYPWDTRKCFDSWRSLVEAISLEMNKYDDGASLTVTPTRMGRNREDDGGGLTLTVKENGFLVLGLGLAGALGLRQQASDDKLLRELGVPGPNKCLFKPGKYFVNNPSSYFDDFMEKDRLLYLKMDVVRPNVFGETYDRVVYACKAGVETETPGNPCELSQSPIRAVYLSFVDHRGDPIYFCASDVGEAVFWAQIVFEKELKL